MGRPPLRKSGAYSDAERQRRHRLKLKAERRAAQEAASIRGKRDPIRFLLSFNTRLGLLLRPLPSKERLELLDLVMQIVVHNLEHEQGMPGDRRFLPLPLILGKGLHRPDPALWDPGGRSPD